MKFSDMPYSRPDADGIKKQIAALTEKLKAAKARRAPRKQSDPLESGQITVEELLGGN